MIREISSTLPSFKSLQFHEGLNILVADRTDSSTDRQTRNRAGKSSSVELIHFLLGGNADKDSIFRNPALKDHRFGMRLDVHEEDIVVERSGADPSRVYIQAKRYDSFPIAPETRRGREPSLSNDQWKDVLGHAWFKLPLDGANDSHRPSFRSLFSYFARRESAKGFLEPSRQTEMQSKWDQQVALSYLLGLDWTVAQRLELVRRQEKALAVLKKAAKEGAIGAFIPKASELQSQLIVQENEADRLRRVLETYEVLPEYRELEKEASQLSMQINVLLNENTLDRQLVDTMQAALREEEEPREETLEQVYEEAGLVLSETVSKRLEDVREFHRSVVSNRRTYLQAEIVNAEERIRKRDAEKAVHDGRRAEIMRLLSSKGALDQFQKLQKEQSRIDAGVEALRQRYRAAQQLESNRVQLDIERRQLESRLRINLQEQESVVKEAIRVFEEISESLYEEAGSLVLNPSSNGLEIEIHIQGQQSKGIQNMQIFCFDLMLMRLVASRGLGPGFLIHDSHLFDGVDERQSARALAAGARYSKECGWQYIVTMNSDAMPQSFPTGFEVKDYILPVRLTDATEDGGLFGIRF